MIRQLFAVAGACCASAFVVVPASAQAVEQAEFTLSVVEAPETAPSIIVVPAMTPVVFEILADLNSRTSKIDDFFPIRLVRPIEIDGRTVVPEGTLGEGQVVHAAKSGWGGKAGELIITVRYLDVSGTHLPLRRFRMGELETGADRRDTAFAATMVIPLAGFAIKGGEKIVETGTLANAIVSADTEIPLAPQPADAGDATPGEGN